VPAHLQPVDVGHEDVEQHRVDGRDGLPAEGSRPSAASSTSKPPIRRMRPIASRTAGSSSTTMMRTARIVGAQPEHRLNAETTP
jgi:hypothetical protein